MSADEASEGQGQRSDAGDERGEAGDEPPPGSDAEGPVDGPVPFLEELFQGTDEGSTTAGRSS